jgi:hypothetical protein
MHIETMTHPLKEKKTETMPHFICQDVKEIQLARNIMFTEHAFVEKKKEGEVPSNVKTKHKTSVT